MAPEREGREHPFSAGARERSLAGTRERVPAGATSTTRARARIRLDQPRPRRPRLLPEWDPEAFGQLSERIARFIGTGRFLAWMTVVIVLWVLWNVSAPSGLRFDEYPFIFLTLALSLQASYAAPLILLAQNRQDDRARVDLEQDRKQNERSIADTEYLTRELAALRIGLGEVATREWIRSELQDFVKELEDRANGHGSSRASGHGSHRSDGRGHGTGDGHHPVFPSEPVRGRDMDNL